MRGCLLLVPALVFAQGTVIQDKDVEYWDVDGVKLAMDILRPKAAGKYPGVVLVHGGGFVAGTRKDFQATANTLARHGYVAASVSYRLAPAAKFPAQIHDVKAAVRFLRANAARFALDADHIGAIGVSAGGTIALFLGVSRGVAELEGPGPFRDQSSSVACVVNLFGRSDLITAYGGSRNAAAVLPQFVGGELPFARLEHVRASPLQWVTPSSAPVLSIHGTLDLNVPYPQSVALRERLWAAGVENELETIEGAGHGFKGKDAVRADRRMLEFFDKHLKRAPLSLDERIQRAVFGFEGNVSLYAKNLDSGKSIGVREDVPVRTASTIKLPILVAALTAVSEGKAKWDEPLTLTAEQKVGGSGSIRELSTGLKLPLKDLAHMMIVVSDNTATNLILDRFTTDYVNEQMDKLGFQQTRSMRKILGDPKNGKPEMAGLSKEGLIEENQKYGIGRSTPHEMVHLLERIEKGQIISADASAQMIAILKRQQFKDGIGRRLDGKFPIASKSGALDALRSDVGIVYTKLGRVAMAITVDGMPKVDYGPENVGNALIGKLAEILVEGLAHGSGGPPASN